MLFEPQLKSGLIPLDVTMPETGLGEMDFTRLKTDGSVLQARRTSVYQLKKFPDGWRITSFGAGPVNCFAAPAAAPAKAN